MSGLDVTPSIMLTKRPRSLNSNKVTERVLCFRAKLFPSNVERLAILN
jgi:hypothetical protein